MAQASNLPADAGATDATRRLQPCPSLTRKRRRTRRARPPPAAAAPGRARRGAARSRASVARRGLEQRHLDLIGLGLVAAGVYLGFVLYVGWDGGPVGEWLQRALANAAGRIAYVVPLALAGLGRWR